MIMGVNSYQAQCEIFIMSMEFCVGVHPNSMEELIVNVVTV